MPIKLSVAPQQFVNADGKPIAGRVTFFHHDSNEIATVYTMEGDQFVVAENPRLLDEMGRLTETIFFDADILDMKVERYIGDPGGMTVDSPDFDSFDTFEVGIDYKTLLEQTGHVADIAELKELDVSEFQSAVVEDYPYRRYIWDAYATNTPDDGVVVKSDVTSSGRWLLVWEDEILPSSIYGVKDGNFANITMLLSYPDVVGSIGMYTPPVVRFEPGVYAMTTWVSTTKTVAFGKGVRFTGGGIEAPMVRQLSAIDNYVCDFILTDKNSEVHSSWFRSVGKFWNSNAGKLIIDDTNYFAVNYLDSVCTVEDAVIEGTKRIAMTSTSSNYLVLRRCTVNAKRVFDPRYDYIRFNSMEVTDDIFTNVAYNYWDIGAISEGHHVEIFGTGAASYPLQKYISADVWLKIYSADQLHSISPNTEVDLKGRTVSNFNYPQFTTVRNMHVTGGMAMPTQNYLCYVYNVEVDGYVSGGNVLYVEDCKLNWIDTTTLTNLTAVNSTVSTYSADIDHSVTINATDCTFNMGINNLTDNETKPDPITLTGCRITSGNLPLKSKRFYFYDCVFDNPIIEIWPYYDGSNYRIDGVMSGCTFRGAYNVHYTKNHVGQYGSEETNCHHVIFRYKWLNNKFTGTADKGILIDFWGVHNDHQQFVASMDNDVIYDGNSGNCPPDKVRCSYNTSSTADTYRFFNDGTWTYNDWHIGGLLSTRAVPEFNGRNGNGAITDFVKHAHRYAFPFNLIMQRHACIELMPSPDDYGDFCAIIYASLNQFSTTQLGLV